MSLAGLVCAAIFMLADVSQSVNDPDYELQRDGTAAAFESPALHSAIVNRPLAVAYAEFSDTTTMRVSWRVLQTAEDANDFARDIRSLTRGMSGWTATGDALRYAVEQLRSPPCDAAEKTIDIVSDGQSNVGVPPRLSRDLAISEAVRINGLAIGDPNNNPRRWMLDNVITPEAEVNGLYVPAGFVVEAGSWDTFLLTFRRKLIMEQTQWNREDIAPEGNSG